MDQPRDSLLRILLVEDDPDVASFICRGLEDEGLHVFHVDDGRKALAQVSAHWSLVILDLSLPHVDGSIVLESLRNNGNHAPVLVLTARGYIEDKTKLFAKGCDDYLVKPFAFEELLHRTRALLRRSPRINETNRVYGDLSLDSAVNTLVRQSGESVRLTPTETRICSMLMDSADRVVSRRELLVSIWGRPDPTEHDANALAVHVHHLKKKMQKLGRGDLVRTVRGSGFVLTNVE